MIINHKNISCGYLGNNSSNSVLNSKYFYLLFKSVNDSSLNLSNVIPFPQKIPRSGFFDELFALETPYYRKLFNEKIKFLLDCYQLSLKKIRYEPNEKNVREVINWINILSRYGQFEAIKKYFPSDYKGPFNLEVKLLKELNEIEINLSNDQPVIVDNLIGLANKYSHCADIEILHKIQLSTQIIVNYHRHQKKLSHRNDILKYATYVIDLVPKFENSSFTGIYHTSIAYRGLAMAAELGPEMQSELLSRAESLARTLKGQTELENIIAQENLYTCLQTMSKWSSHNENFKACEKYLLEMIDIDPNDSTAFSELGFFYINRKLYDKAAQQFYNALCLGPPGAGMNAYYYAKCLEKLGRSNEAMSFLYKSANLDKQAISPWLDLLDHYTQLSQNNDVLMVANHIYNSPILMEQLNKDEIYYIHELIS